MHLPTQNGNLIPVAPTPHRTTQTVAFTAASAQSAALGALTNVVRLVPDQDCFVLMGDNPTAASATSIRLIANQVEWFGVTPGQRIAVIRSTADGTLRIEEF